MTIFDTAENIQKEIDEADNVLKRLDVSGRHYLKRLKANPISFARSEPGVIFPAYWNGYTRTFHLQPNISLTLRFNFRVHEGAHLLQMDNTSAAKALIEMVEPDSRALSVRDIFRIRRIMEVGAYSTQAYFNALAVGKTGNFDFVDCMRHPAHTGSYDSYTDLQTNLILSGRSPQAIKEIVAEKYLNLPLTVHIAGQTPIHMNQAELTDMAFAPALAASTPDMFAQEDQISVDRLGTVLNASLPFANTQRVLDAFRKPFKTHALVQEVLSARGLVI